mmetsp:Transcript_105511/g.303415  ORF Transcript_105511/g.303415 Transcript_105511/m.303415 type:complete len:306 (-) Transcript_105511:129-1046(-)
MAAREAKRPGAAAGPGGEHRIDKTAVPVHPGAVSAPGGWLGRPLPHEGGRPEGAEQTTARAQKSHAAQLQAAGDRAAGRQRHPMASAGLRALPMGDRLGDVVHELASERLASADFGRPLDALGLRLGLRLHPQGTPHLQPRRRDLLAPLTGLPDGLCRPRIVRHLHLRGVCVRDHQLGHSVPVLQRVRPPRAQVHAAGIAGLVQRRVVHPPRLVHGVAHYCSRLHRLRLTGRPGPGRRRRPLLPGKAGGHQRLQCLGDFHLFHAHRHLDAGLLRGLLLRELGLRGRVRGRVCAVFAQPAAGALHG